MIFHIRNMVCNRCRTAVEQTLKKIGLTPVKIDLGLVEVKEAGWNSDQKEQFEALLKEQGFELLDDRRSQLIEQIKTAIVDLIHYQEDQTRLKHSEYITNRLHYDYAYLSKLFSETEGLTIEQFIITHKIEKVKEWLTYDELTLSQIADRLNYSSVAHLSTQFKKVTGMTPTYFKTLHNKNRKPLDEV